jgi:hypothetical protein
MLRRWWPAVLVACATAPVRAPETTPPALPAPAPATAPAPPTTGELLAARAVHHDAYARSVLYTWTTPPQVAALREHRRLLVAESKDGFGRSVYLRGLARLAAEQPIAGLLLEHPGLARRRYAWPNPYATTMGLGPIRYGDCLIKVELAATAVIVRFRPADAAPFAAVDLQGRDVPIAALVADPSRIAAVYHVRDGPTDELAFREYVLVNEAQVAGWSVATPEVRAQVDADVALIEALKAELAWLPAAAVRAPAAPAWAAALPGMTLLDRWHASLAFDNLRYRPGRADLAAIAAALRSYDPAGEPLVHRPGAVFPGHGGSVGQASR